MSEYEKWTTRVINNSKGDIMFIKLFIEVEEVILDGEGCGGTKKQLEDEFESYFDSAIINGYKVIECKVIDTNEG